MAKYYGANWTAAIAVPNAVPVPSGDGGGSERAFYDSYLVPTGGLQIGDTIDFCQPSGSLKPGDRVVSAELVTDAAAASATLALGDDGSAGRFISASSIASAGRLALNNYANFGWQVDQERPIRATVGGAVIAAGLNIKCRVVVLRS